MSNLVLSDQKNHSDFRRFMQFSYLNAIFPFRVIRQQYLWVLGVIITLHTRQPFVQNFTLWWKFQTETCLMSCCHTLWHENIYLMHICWDSNEKGQGGGEEKSDHIVSKIFCLPPIVILGILK